MKSFKKILSLLLILALGVCLAFTFTACGDPEDDPCTEHVDDDKNGKCDKCGETVEPAGDGKIDYTVVVKDDEGNTVSGATVVILQSGVIERGEAVTDSEGKATFNLVEGEYSAEIVSVPSGYAFEEETIAFANGVANLTVEKLPVYTIYVKDEAGAPVVGVQVQICDDAGCRLPQLTDAEGKAEFVYAESNFKAQLSKKHDGYVADDSYHYFNGYEVTITLVAE